MPSTPKCSGWQSSNWKTNDSTLRHTSSLRFQSKDYNWSKICLFWKGSTSVIIIDVRTQFTALIDERTRVHSVKTSFEVTHPSTDRGQRAFDEQAILIMSSDVWQCWGQDDVIRHFQVVQLLADSYYSFRVYTKELSLFSNILTRSKTFPDI